MLKGYEYTDGHVIVPLPDGRRIYGEMDDNNVLWFSEKDAVRVYIYNGSWWIDVITVEDEVDTAEPQLTENNAAKSSHDAIDAIAKSADVWNGTLSKEEVKQYIVDNFDVLQKNIKKYLDISDGTPIKDRNPSNVDIKQATDIFNDIVSNFEDADWSNADENMLIKHIAANLRVRKLEYRKSLPNR